MSSASYLTLSLRCFATGERREICNGLNQPLGHVSWSRPVSHTAAHYRHMRRLINIRTVLVIRAGGGGLTKQHCNFRVLHMNNDGTSQSQNENWNASTIAIKTAWTHAFVFVLVTVSTKWSSPEIAQPHVCLQKRSQALQSQRVEVGYHKYD